jgi:hypothetical protein
MNAAQDRFQGQLKVYSEKIYKWIIRIIQGNSEKLYLCYTQSIHFAVKALQLQPKSTLDSRIALNL